jgi:transcriptional regulator with XRE-family HTH domain
MNEKEQTATERFKTNLRNRMSRDSISESALARKSGVPVSTVNSVLKRDISPKIDTAEALAKGLDTSLIALLRKPK